MPSQKSASRISKEDFCLKITRWCPAQHARLTGTQALIRVLSRFSCLLGGSHISRTPQLPGPFLVPISFMYLLVTTSPWSLSHSPSALNPESDLWVLLVSVLHRKAQFTSCSHSTDIFTLLAHTLQGPVHKIQHTPALGAT